MIARFARPLVVLGAVAAVAGLISADRTPPEPIAPYLAGAVVPPMAAIPAAKHLSTSWFCPGVPAGQLPGATGTISVANTTESALTARVTFFPAGGAPITRPITVAPRTRLALSPAELAPSTLTAALVEMTDGVGAVEQTVTAQEGVAVSPCVLEPSSEWYLADGSTRVDASMNLLLFNPSPTDAIVDLVFADEENTRITKKFEGRVVPARSLSVFDIGQVILRKERLSVAATVRSGAVVMGRFQAFRGEDGTRRGLMVGAASPALSSTWRFAAGQVGEAGEGTLPASERIVVFNPNDNDAKVSVTLFPATPPAAPVVPADGDATSAVPVPGAATPKPIEITVAARQSAAVDLAGAEVLPGLYSAIVTSDVPVVAERALDRTESGKVLGTLQLGSPLASTDWVLPAGAPAGSEATLAIVNATGLPGVVTVKALGPAGLVNVPGYEEVALAGGELIRLDLAAKGVSASAIVVSSTVDVVVERITRSLGGWSSALGLPVLGS